MESSTRGKMSTAADKKAAGERFLKGTFSGNLLHVGASEHALAEVNDPQVRKLAELLIADHTAANQKLSAVAKAEGVELPTEMLPPQKTMLDAAKMVKGEAFAATYLFNMYSLHARSIVEFSYVASTSEDEAIKAYATASLPILKQHYKNIRPLAEDKARLQNGLEGS